MILFAHAKVKKVLSLSVISSLLQKFENLANMGS